ncbi:MAG: hypothetical protein EAZ13_07200 [Sphingobacteriia bacterium]|nr:MAG: hypothetical protein EAZ41_09510 [Sphingobacteriia bacterium]TAG29988.1 MAG: hypothetical protein EAZ35_08985 [Sphingobacteriia bacterium]TAH07097.1 MAG: hypothetical protein EAZ13_07200 [Sphingobacteriia bacterium]
MKKENIQVAFTMQGIKTEQFAIFEDHYAPKKGTGLGTELQFKLDHKNKQIGVFLGFEFLQGKKIFLKIQVSCHFKIEESSWNNFIQKAEAKLVVPKGFLAHLAMITTGTTRGVLFAKTESTPFSKFIVPTLNVAEMITENTSFDMIIES